MPKHVKQVADCRLSDDGQKIEVVFDLTGGRQDTLVFSLVELDYLQQALMVAVNEAAERMIEGGMLPMFGPVLPGVVMESFRIVAADKPSPHMLLQFHGNPFQEPGPKAMGAAIVPPDVGRALGRNLLEVADELDRKPS